MEMMGITGKAELGTRWGTDLTPAGDSSKMTEACSLNPDFPYTEEPMSKSKSNRREFLEQCSLTLGACALMSGSGLMAASASANDAVNAEQIHLDAVNPEKQPEVGTPWRAWQEGEWDMHAIFTGRGESTFHIFPDGTSMLLDAGDFRYEKSVKQLPDESRRAGEWVTRYILRVNPAGKHVDYVMLSHFHSDHGGEETKGSEKTEGREPNYTLSGIPQVGETVKFDIGFDRGYPDYATPRVVNESECTNFRRFTEWKVKQGELTMEEFRVGALDQIKLRKKPDAYDFHVRNLSRNGTLWVGENDADKVPGVVLTDEAAKTVDFFKLNPKNAAQNWINENSLSLGMRMDYGPFRFYTAGDLSWPLKGADDQPVQLEGLVGKVTGPVDVCKVNHHAYKDAMVPEFVREVRPRVFIQHVWDQLHIQDNTMTNMASTELYAGERIVCPTCFPPERAELYKDAPWLPVVAKHGGHVVVRVFDGGRQFKVYYLTANDESMTIKAVYGPFTAKRAG